MSEITIGVIGCGAMGRVVIRDVCAHEPRVRIAAVYDPDDRSRTALAEDLGYAPQEFSQYEDVCTHPDVSWVFIASWNYNHCAQIIAAFNAGKHVFCQKPLALTTEECAQILRAWRASSRQLSIGFTLRYSPHYRRIKEIVASGTLGTLISMECNETLDFNHGGYIMGDWRRKREYAGSHMLEKCCHDIDLMNWITASRAARIASFGGLNFFVPENVHIRDELGVNDKGKKAYATWPGLISEDPFLSDKDIEDNQVVIIEYENAIRATFHTNCNAGIPERRMYLLGTKGALRADVLTGKIELKKIGFDTKIEDISTDAVGGHGCGDEVLARELVASMRDGAPPAAGVEEGVCSTVTCCGIDDAMRSGNVVDMKPYWERIDTTVDTP